MSKLKVELNRAGVRELLQSEEMMEVCEEYASEVMQRVGSGYELSKHTGKNRVNVSVQAATIEAIQDNLDNNTLLKAIGSGL